MAEIHPTISLNLWKDGCIITMVYEVIFGYHHGLIQKINYKAVMTFNCIFILYITF